MQTMVAETPRRDVFRAPLAARRWGSPRFYICVAILLISAAGMQALAAWFEGYFQKMPLPLRKPLWELDVSKLGPEYRLHEVQPHPLPKEEIENLGTEELLHWFIIDETKSPGDPARVARVFVTYFTGKPDMVPHEPRECWVAGGYALVGVDRTTVPIELPDGRKHEIGVEVLDFEKQARAATLDGPPPRQTVLFFFWANGKFVTTRNGVRFAVMNLKHRYAFYTKVEVTFMNEPGTASPDREAAKKAVQPLLQKLVPVLMTDHYQDWDAITAGRTTE